MAAVEREPGSAEIGVEIEVEEPGVECRRLQLLFEVPIRVLEGLEDVFEHRARGTSCEELARIALGLCERIEHGPQQLYRLVGVVLSNFQIDIETEAPLFS